MAIAAEPLKSYSHTTRGRKQFSGFMNEAAKRALQDWEMAAWTAFPNVDIGKYGNRS